MGNRPLLQNYLKLHYLFCLVRLWPSKQFIFEKKIMWKAGKKKKGMTSEIKAWTSNWNHPVLMSNSKLTELPDFHILAACFGIITLISIFSCNVISTSGISPPCWRHQPFIPLSQGKYHLGKWGSGAWTSRWGPTVNLAWVKIWVL